MIFLFLFVFRWLGFQFFLCDETLFGKKLINQIRIRIFYRSSIIVLSFINLFHELLVFFFILYHAFNLSRDTCLKLIHFANINISLVSHDFLVLFFSGCTGFYVKIEFIEDFISVLALDSDIRIFFIEGKTRDRSL